MSHSNLLKKRNSHNTSLNIRVVTETKQQKQNLNVPSKITKHHNKSLNQNQNQIISLDRNIDQNLSSIKDTLTVLREYQKLCIQKEDFLQAQQTKNKITFLQSQQKIISKQQKVLKTHQSLQQVCKQGEQEVQNFQEYWDETIKKLIDQLKQIETSFIRQQQQELNQYKEKISNKQAIKIKYSPKIIELRKNLTCLIKMRKYKDADEVKNLIKQLEAQCEEESLNKNEDRVKVLLQKFEKKQLSELKALRSRIQAVFNQKIKQRDEKFEILLKRNRKRQIQTSKSKISKMNQSQYTRSRSQSRMVIGNSKVSVVNISNH